MTILYCVSMQLVHLIEFQLSTGCLHVISLWTYQSETADFYAGSIDQIEGLLSIHNYRALTHIDSHLDYIQNSVESISAMGPML